MPTDSPANPPLPPRRRRLRRIAVVLLVGLLGAAGLAYYATRHLSLFARWALERAFPGASVEIRRLDLAWPNRLDAETLVLKSRKDGATLLSLEGGNVVFDFPDIRHRRIGEVRLVRPVIEISPRFFEAFAPPPGSPRKTSGSPWSVRRLICEAGRIQMLDVGAEGLTVTAGFALDLSDFSPDSEPGKIHRIDFSDIIGATATEGTFLTLKNLALGFSLADLTKDRRIARIEFDQLALSVSPKLLAAFPSSPGKSPQSAAPDWRVDEIVCDYGQLSVAGYGHPDLAVRTKLAFRWQNVSLRQPELDHRIVLWELAAALGQDDFFRLDLVRIGFSTGGLLQERKLGSLGIQGGSLVLGEALRQIFDTPAGSPPPPPASSAPFVLGTLEIRDVAVRIDDNRPEISDITFALNTTLQSIPLGQAAADLGDEGHFIEIADLVVASPLDPLTRVMTLESISVRFTLAGLLKRRIQDVLILRPTIHLGEDLFWYMEDMEKRLGTSSGSGGGSGWVIDTLRIRDGQLSVGSGGRKQYGLPVNFRTIANDVALDNLASLKLRATLEIPPEKYSFASYQLEFTSEKGELQFAYPPEKQENNLVGTVKLTDIRWRQYRAKDSWISVTFDRKGINGQFGGKAYQGDAGGGFSFFFDSTSPWIGWFFGKGIDLRQFTDVLSPQNFQMTGPVNFKLQMDAQGRNIDRIVGDLQTPRPGQLVIRKLDDLLERIPGTWNLLKQSSTRIGLEALRDFAYTKGDGDFWFVQSQGLLRLRLQGPQGSRNFDVALHADDTPDGWWKRRPDQELKQPKKP